MTRPRKNITKSLASAMTLGTSAVDSQLASWRVSVVPTSESVPTRPCTLREISAVLSEPNVANSDCTAPCAWARSPGRRSSSCMSWLTNSGSSHSMRPTNTAMTTTSAMSAPSARPTPWRSSQLVMELQMNPTTAPTSTHCTADSTEPSATSAITNASAHPTNAQARAPTRRADS